MATFIELRSQLDHLLEKADDAEGDRRRVDFYNELSMLWFTVGRMKAASRTRFRREIYGHCFMQVKALDATFRDEFL